MVYWQIKITLEISIGQFITWLEFSIIFVIFLDSIVCQMNESISKVFHIELFASCSNVTILIPISFHTPIDWCDQNVSSDIKFSLLIQKRNDVLLNDVSSRLSFSTLSIFFNDTVNLLQSLNNNNSIASVCIFTWFYQPSVSSFRLKSILNLIIWIVFFGFLFLLYFLISFVVFLQKVVELFVSFFFNMKSHWNVYEWILFLAFIIRF